MATQFTSAAKMNGRSGCTAKMAWAKVLRLALAYDGNEVRSELSGASARMSLRGSSDERTAEGGASPWCRCAISSRRTLVTPLPGSLLQETSPQGAKSGRRRCTATQAARQVARSVVQRPAAMARGARSPLSARTHPSPQRTTIGSSPRRSATSSQASRPASRRCANGATHPAGSPAL